MAIRLRSVGRKPMVALAERKNALAASCGTSNVMLPLPLPLRSIELRRRPRVCDCP